MKIKTVLLLLQAARDALLERYPALRHEPLKAGPQLLRVFNDINNAIEGCLALEGKP